MTRGTGKLILVGAGPGDPDLITLRGVTALGRADLVLYDELASDDLLRFAAEHAECVNVGKRGHDSPTLPQEDINALIVERALAGDTVVRLKGGDPFVFGRGGEEASACVEAGIPYEVVPGVSSPIGALAYAGIPVTDRRHAASFAVVTGHKDPTRAAQATRWGELARAVDTLVILMGMRNLPEIIEQVLAGGRDPQTPAAAVHKGTLGTQEVVVAPLCELVARVSEAGLRAPAAVVIGEVVRLRETLAWWEKAPLFGKRVLVTRAREQASELASALRAAGAEPVLLPMIRLAPPSSYAELDRALASLSDYDAIVFASSNAVRFFVERARQLKGGEDVPFAFSRIAARILCVGPQTARAAVEAGFAVHLTASGRGNAEALLSELMATVQPEGRRFLIPKSDIARKVMPEGLRAAGAVVDAVETYRNVPAEADAGLLRSWLGRGELEVLTFTSPSAVRNFFALLDPAARSAVSRCLVVAVGDTTGKALEGEGFPAQVIPERPGALEMVSALVDYLAGDLAEDLAEDLAGDSD
ncbi:MAG: uroporphyrinogen-III C-methyltransferase [Deltaproteobacteria bacterium]|nr:uroporphyrinogen-III C-methyltransferase [Deltaproteobacteria bacterium]